ncbi:prepilin peptidase [Bordetella sp. BOR01]|uniref:A24 family peptidase n=1 Tax=Bordetella sp. BOR01 TaxID=2854779 RepID=UPI002102FBCA|nr:A24 family peptidase [Bordetella sp. BOR01]
MSLGESLWWVLFILWSLMLVLADWRHRRIPNVLVAAAACLQVLWAIAAAAGMGWQYSPLWPGWGMALLGFLVALLFVPLWMCRAMGAGDVKVIAVYGLAFGPVRLALVLAVGSLLAGMHAALYWIVAHWWVPSAKLRKVPYAAYLAMGALSVAYTLLSSRWSS